MQLNSLDDFGPHNGCYLHYFTKFGSWGPVMSFCAKTEKLRQKLL